MGRAPCCDKANVKRGPWSPEEDAKLKSYIEKHGTGGNWIALPQKIGLKRCGKSCRLRWLNYLRPNIKHGGFTEEEDNLICSLYISIGSRWSIIAAQLPGRTDNDIKNYWNTRLKKKLLGKQRKEQQARRESCTHKQSENTKRGSQENFSIDECFDLYPRPPQMVPPPPLSVGGYATPQQANSTLVDISIMPPFQAKLANFVDHSHRNAKNFGNFRYVSEVSCSQNQELFRNPMIRLAPSTCTAFLNSSCPLPNDFHAINGLAGNNIQAFDDIAEEVMYNMAQNLDGVDSFSSVDLVNSSTITTTVSPENTNLGDISSLIYPSALPDYEACQPKVTQEWTYFDEPRLLGYS